MACRKLLLLLVVLGLIFAGCTVVVADTVTRPFEIDHWTTPESNLDVLVKASLTKRGRDMRNPCSDEVFIRRVYLDIIGTLPTPQEVDAFLQDRRTEKRAALIDSLFTRDEFADYWALKWCDVLRVKSEFPINLWPNAVQAYHRWIHDAIQENRPYDQVARELLTSSGSNFTVPPANFYRAVSSHDPETLAKAVALSFMGTRLERWPDARRADMANFFSRVAYKKTDEWKEEIVYFDTTAKDPLKVTFPDGTTTIIPADKDPRQVFADWLMAPNNPWFARNIVNRIWAWTMGHGIIDEADDIRPDNPPASPEVLSYLEKELVASQYDLRHIYRVILNSHTYQQSALPHGEADDPKVEFARYTIRRLDAEVLIDALCYLGNDGVGYSSATPEPYTFIPKDQRTITLADGSITSSFLATFGRPARDSGLLSERSSQPSDAQSLYLLNSSDVQQKIARSQQLRQVITKARGNVSAIIRGVYMLILSRNPSPDESTVAEQYFKSDGMQPWLAAGDLMWALINSKEFLYRH